MTSFERPDASLLVEHLLPSLLGTSHSLSQEILDRNLFFGELGTTLETLHGRLTVISSPARGSRVDAQYPWVWRYVSHFSVGSQAPAVQHAKLWAFHWKIDDGEALEIHVSSTNLTASGFKNQVQAGWQVILTLGARTAASSRRSWGSLVPFLEALGTSAGAEAATRLHRLVNLLGRAECPAGVSFVASVPGKVKAARQFAALEPSEIHVFTPTVGDWNERTLSTWCADAGIAPTRIRLKWIPQDHPWVGASGWAMSKGACENLRNSGVRLDRIPCEARLSEHHHDGDPRWSHAKLYLVRSRRRRRLLVTSANWSVAAWGAGRTASRNFELGVVFDSDWADLERFKEQFGPPDSVPFCVDRVDDEVRVIALEWAEASWDGRHIRFRARSADSVASIRVCVMFTGSQEQSIQLVNGEAVWPWNDAERTPIGACFTQGDAMLEVDVIDLRPPSEFVKTRLPEVDPTVEKVLREAFLLQRYGGPLVDPESIRVMTGGLSQPEAATFTNNDYAVQAWIDARAAFHVLDKWRAALDEAKDDAPRRERVCLDGEGLRALFARRAGPGARLVVEELGWRLDEEG